MQEARPIVEVGVEANIVIFIILVIVLGVNGPLFLKSYSHSSGKLLTGHIKSVHGPHI